MEEDLSGNEMGSETITEVVEQIKTCISDNTAESSVSVNERLPKLLSALQENLQKYEKVESLPDIISVVLVSVTHSLPPKDWDNLIFRPFIPIVKLHLSDTISAVHVLLESNLPDSSLIPELSKSLDICVQLLNDVDALLEFILGLSHISTAHVFHLPQNIADIVLEVFMHCRKSPEEYKHLFPEVGDEIRSLFKKCHNVQLNLFKLLNDKITFNYLSEKEITLLVEVLCVLQNTGEVVGELDTMSLVAHWKGFAVLMKAYSNHLTSRLDVSCSINYLATTIKRQLDSVDVLISHDMKSIMKLLKVTNMQLKILIKLCEQFKFHLGDCHTELLNCLITLSTNSSQYLAERGVPDGVAAQVTNLLSSGAAPMLSHLLADPKFNQAFLDYPDKLHTSSLPDQLGYCNLFNLVLRKLIQMWPKDKEIQDVWIENSSTVVTTAFSILENCSKDALLIFSTENDIYQSLLTHTAALIVATCSEDKFDDLEQILMKNLLQENLWPAIFSSDLLCLIARLGTSELCLELTRLLHQMLLCWPPCDRARLELVFVAWTLGRLAPLMSSDHNKAFVCDLPSPLDLATDLSSLLTKPVSEDTLLRFNSFVDKSSAMGELTVFPENVRPVLSQPLLQLWQHMAALSAEENHHWSLALYSYLVTSTSTLSGSYNNIQLANVLDVLLKMSQKTSLFTFGACEFLRSLAPRVLSSDPSLSLVCERISSLFSQLMLSEHPLTKQMGLETFAYFAFVTKYEQIVSETVASHRHLQQDISSFLDGNPTVDSDTSLEDFQKSLVHKFEHKCPVSFKREDESAVGNPSKKLKVSHEEMLEENSEWPDDSVDANFDQRLEERIEQRSEKMCSEQEIPYDELQLSLRRIEENIVVVQNYVNCRPLSPPLLTRLGNIKEICSKILEP